MPAKYQFTLKSLLLFTAFVSVLCAVFVPKLRRQHEVAKGIWCAAHMMHIGSALSVYHAKHGCFPPAYTTDGSGKPMHSWRVLILPYLGYDHLYQRYNFAEPWNGPNNRLLASEMPEIYRCPGSRGAKNTTTDCVAVLGSETPWPGNRSVTHSDFPDGSSRTLLVVEVPNSGIHWMEPRDSTIEEQLASLDAQPQSAESRIHPAGRNFLFANGSVRQVKQKLSAEVLRALLTRNGGEPVEEHPDTYDFFLDKE